MSATTLTSDPTVNGQATHDERWTVADGPQQPKEPRAVELEVHDDEAFVPDDIGDALMVPITLTAYVKAEELEWLQVDHAKQLPSPTRPDDTVAYILGSMLDHALWENNAFYRAMGLSARCQELMGHYEDADNAVMRAVKAIRKEVPA